MRFSNLLAVLPVLLGPVLVSTYASTAMAGSRPAPPASSHARPKRVAGNAASGPRAVASTSPAQALPPLPPAVSAPLPPSAPPAVSAPLPPSAPPPATTSLTSATLPAGSSSSAPAPAIDRATTPDAAAGFKPIKPNGWVLQFGTGIIAPASSFVPGVGTLGPGLGFDARLGYYVTPHVGFVSGPLCQRE